MIPLFARWLTLIEKRRAQRSYIQKLGPLMRKRYGRSRYYTVAQVQKTVEVSGLNPNYICYGLSEYCSEDDFNTYHQNTGESCDYHEMRSEMATSWSVGHSGGSYCDSLESQDSFGHDHGGSGHSGDGGGGGHGH